MAGALDSHRSCMRMRIRPSSAIRWHQFRKATVVRYSFEMIETVVAAFWGGVIRGRRILDRRMARKGRILQKIKARLEGQDRPQSG